MEPNFSKTMTESKNKIHLCQSCEISSIILVTADNVSFDLWQRHNKYHSREQSVYIFITYPPKKKKKLDMALRTSRLANSGVWGGIFKSNTESEVKSTKRFSAVNAYQKLNSDETFKVMHVVLLPHPQQMNYASYRLGNFLQHVVTAWDGVRGTERYSSYFFHWKRCCHNGINITDMFYLHQPYIYVCCGFVILCFLTFIYSHMSAIAFGETLPSVRTEQPSTLHI